jgi:GAF domain-containing protein/HAMP domain-containing protein
MDKQTTNTSRTQKTVQPRSLRTRLILANMIITFLAILGMGFYIYYRAQQANQYLTTQLSDSVYQQAQDNLTATSNEQTLQLNNFFLTISQDISNLGASLSRLLSLQPGTTSYWDASLSLTRLSNGSWDNSNDEIASVFIPAAVDLTDPLIAELNTARQIDFIVPPLLDANPNVVALYFGGMFGETLYYPNIDLSTIVPPDFNVTQRPWFVDASPAQNPERLSVWSAPYLDAALHGLIITCSTPVYDERGDFRGVTAMDIQLNQITEIVTNIRVGQTGYAFLIDNGKRLIAMPDSGYQDLGILPDDLPLGEILAQGKLTTPISAKFWELLVNMSEGRSGLDTIRIGDTERYIIYQPVPEVGYSLAIIVPTQELLADAIAANQQIARVTQNTVLVSLLLIAAILVVALLATLGIGNRLTRPLTSLTRTAEEIARGNLNTEAVVTSHDEIGILARAFNSMTARLRDMIANLENRVSDRTTSLEQRTSQLQAATRISQDTSTVQDLHSLLSRTVDLISNYYGYYHAGIYLVDATGDYAVLQAASSEGGKKMIARGYKLEVSQRNLVGASAYENRSRVVMDTSHDVTYQENPDLPKTQSQITIPLAPRGKVLGVLDIQSTERNAFAPDQRGILQTLADQIALAIQNVLLVEENRLTLNRMEAVLTENVRRAWGSEVGGESKSAYRFTPTNLTKIQSSDRETGSIPERTTPLKIPITLRGQKIGNIELLRKGENAWSDADRALVSDVANQIGLALENSRLLRDAQQHALYEQTLSELTSKLGLSVDTDTLLQTAIRELHQLPNTTEVSVVLTSPKSIKTKEK